MSSLIMTTKSIKKQIMPILKRQGVIKAALFGSIARGEMKKNSDIDILVKLKKGKSLFDFVGLKLELEEKLGKKVDLVTYTFKKDVLEREEEEFRLAYRIVCPSEFTRKSFIDQGYAPGKLLRHFRGVDEKRYYPGTGTTGKGRDFTMLFVGACALLNNLRDQCLRTVPMITWRAASQRLLQIYREVMDDYKKEGSLK